MDEKLEALLTSTRRLYSDAKLYLFGSRAVGTAREDSDYDLIVISKKFAGTPFPNRPGIIRRQLKIAIAADLLCYTPKEFERISKTSAVLRDALKHAVIV